jgi:uncharacterized protein YutE (UPF0331/DUF86 family)
MRLEEKIAKLKTQMKELQAIETLLNESPDKQVSLTDPDARSMMTRGTGIVGYNVQTAVDTQHHLIVAHEVTNVGSDRDQLSSMAKQAREAIASETLSVVADRGYFKREQILADSCLFSTEGMIDNVQIQEVYHSYAALSYLQTDNGLTSKKSRIRFHRTP